MLGKARTGRHFDKTRVPKRADQNHKPKDKPHAFLEQVSAGGELLSRQHSFSTLFGIHRVASAPCEQTPKQLRKCHKGSLPQTKRRGSHRQCESALPFPDDADIVLQGDWDKWLHKTRGTWSKRHVAITNDALCISFEQGGEVRDLLTLMVNHDPTPTFSGTNCMA